MGLAIGAKAVIDITAKLFVGTSALYSNSRCLGRVIFLWYTSIIPKIKITFLAHEVHKNRHVGNALSTSTVNFGQLLRWKVSNLRVERDWLVNP